MPRNLFILGLVAIMGIVGVWVWNLVPTANERAAPSRVTIGGPFTLIDHNGKAATDADFRGRHLLVFFGYTFCPDVCPTAMLSVTEAIDLLGKKAEKVQPLFISIDPERDTPEVLKSFVENFHPRMIGLTGTVEQVAAAAKAYRVRFGKQYSPDSEGKDDYLMFHSASIFLMDAEGKFIRPFKHDTAPEVLADKILEVL